MQFVIYCIKNKIQDKFSCSVSTIGQSEIFSGFYSGLGEDTTAATMSTMKFCREWYAPLYIDPSSSLALDQSYSYLMMDGRAATTSCTPRRTGTGAPYTSHVATASTRYNSSTSILVPPTNPIQSSCYTPFISASLQEWGLGTALGCWGSNEH